MAAEKNRALESLLRIPFEKQPPVQTTQAPPTTPTRKIEVLPHRHASAKFLWCGVLDSSAVFLLGVRRPKAKLRCFGAKLRSFGMAEVA
jgi:hypothetical protein